MIFSIYKLVIAIWRKLDAIVKQLDRIERKLAVVSNKQDSELEILNQLKDEIVSGPATSLNLMAGPIEEQP